jgi:hypothetical protein
VSLTVAAAVAMSISFVVCGFAAVAFVVPWLKARPWPQAMTPLLAVHLFRHVALQLFSAQRFGFDISNVGRDEIAFGDLAGVTLALLALAAIRFGSALWKMLTWLFVLATVVDLGNSLVVGLREDLFARASGVSWLILTFYVPALWVTIALIAWQLVKRTESTPASLHANSRSVRLTE